MKIYTKTGDKGETSLLGGRRISKDELRIEAYGTVDELNSIIGVARSFSASPDLRRGEDGKRIDDILALVQDQLFVLGADLASPPDAKNDAVRRISAEDHVSLERIIDELDTRLEPLKSFVLPGGCVSASILHLARTVCRRAERRVVSLRKRSDASQETVIYLNRLSDLLFVLARFANKFSGSKETLWTSRGESDPSA